MWRDRWRHASSPSAPLATLALATPLFSRFAGTPSSNASMISDATSAAGLSASVTPSRSLQPPNHVHARPREDAHALWLARPVSISPATGSSSSGSAPKYVVSQTTVVQTETRPAQVPVPVRVVGRGGQGSRLRTLPSKVAVSAGTGVHHTHNPSTPISRRPDNTRIVGRGGMGSKPRDLPALAEFGSRASTPAAASQTLPVPPAAPASVSEQPVYYRPGGRGGAGSRPRKVKVKPPPKAGAAATREATGPRLPWKIKSKGKGKARDATTYGLPGLSRTDTMDTLGSSIQFSEARDVYQSVAAQDREDENPESSLSAEGESGPGLQRVGSGSGRHRLHKLVRRLGVDLRDNNRTPTPTQDYPDGRQRLGRALRRSSLSGFPVSRLAVEDRSAEKARRRRSSFESIPSSLTGQILAQSAQQYPAPPQPPAAFPPELEYEDFNDAHSEALTYDEATTDTDDTSELHSISSTSTHAPLLSSTPKHEDDTAVYIDDDEDYRWDRSPTPTLLSSRWAEHAKHLSAMPFESSTLPSGVSASWEHEEASEMVARNESSQGWYGEWNRGDIRDVISSLRELRM